MNKNLKIKDLMSLEEYSKQRDEIREKVLNHKKSRKIDIGMHVSLLFEDKLTITYQIQEMLIGTRLKQMHIRINILKALSGLDLQCGNKKKLFISF